MIELGQRGFQVEEPVRYMYGWIAADAIMVHPKGKRAFDDCQKHLEVALMNLLTQASFRCALEFPVHTRFLRVESEANSIHDLASSLHNADQSRLPSGGRPWPTSRK